ncbi:50S ribosomal protein L1 [Psilocybe cubensis]|uniref:Ribosomal protein n=2 Tax=Psilocybe cubensis TaxID=181762 RepID=A0A8H7Y4T0_PSICU|nr:50S ribosomal protein L1 [Psilocybe cubensis]KAH9486351.1 50S ribosomal protein L1 [Psilocybe cubensis]
MLSPLLRQCVSSPPCTASRARLFSTSVALQYNRKNNASTIRVPSKKAQAAKARRKALLAAKEDSRFLKLTLEDAIAVLRAVEVASPKSTYELTVKTSVGNGVAVPRGRVNLPREAKAKTEDKILVFAEGRIAEEAKKAGAHIVGGTELIDGILTNRIRATTILCTPALIRAITPKLGRFLGPLGLMPSERRGTVTEDIAGYIQKLHGSSEWRADRTGTIRAPIATMSFPVEDVANNFRQFLLSVKRATGNLKDSENTDRKSGGAKPVTPITRVLLSSSKGPGIRIEDY